MTKENGPGESVHNVKYWLKWANNVDVCEFKGICIIESLPSRSVFDPLMITWRYVADNWTSGLCSTTELLLDTVNSLTRNNAKNASSKAVVNRVAS